MKKKIYFFSFNVSIANVNEELLRLAGKNTDKVIFCIII